MTVRGVEMKRVVISFQFNIMRPYSFFQNAHVFSVNAANVGGCIKQLYKIKWDFAHFFSVFLRVFSHLHFVPNNYSLINLWLI